MKLAFTKMSGGGNDFIVYDNRDDTFPREHRHATIARLCRRGLGVGADAVILLENDDQVDFRMVYYNADGGEAPMCGNGAMCMVRYARLREIVDQPRIRFRAGCGILEAEVVEPDAPEVTLFLDLPTGLMRTIDRLQYPPFRAVGFIDTTTPHVVAEVDDVESLDVTTEGNRLRHDPAWAPAGTNVNFVTVLERGIVRMRTYERGVEAETLSCGTGAAASAILTHLWGHTEPPVEIRTTGGVPLWIDFTPVPDGRTVPSDPSVTGHARVVYEGTLVLDADGDSPAPRSIPEPGTR